MKTERQYLAEYVKTMKKNKTSLVYKIPDMPRSKDKVKCPQCGNVFKPKDNIRFQHPKPFDLIIFTAGKFYAIEAKRITGYTFNFSLLQPHQDEALCNVWHHGGKAMILIFVCIPIKRENDFTEWARQYEDYLIKKDMKTGGEYIELAVYMTYRYFYFERGFHREEEDGIKSIKLIDIIKSVDKKGSIMYRRNGYHGLDVKHEQS